MHAGAGHAPLVDRWSTQAWERVVGALGEPHPFLTPAWQRAWWEELGPAGAPCVLELSDGDAVVGVAALQRGADGLVRPLGDRATCDYPGPAVLPQRARAAMASLLDQLPAGAGLELPDARREDPHVDALVEVAGARGLDVGVVADEPVVVLDLPADAEAWQASLSRHARHELRRKRRRLARRAPAVVRTATAGTLDADLDLLIALHRAAPGEKGAFLTDARAAFLRRVAADAQRAGTLRLDVLEAGEEPLAAAVGFQSGSTAYLYNMAFSRDAAALSPGSLLVAALVERSIGEGLARYDLLRGTERYKLELGGQVRELVRVRVAPR